MEQRSSQLEDIILHNALEESHRHYGGPAPALNPLEALIKAETGQADDGTGAAILLRILSFASDAIDHGGITYSWKRVEKVIKPGNSIHYEKEDYENGVYLPFVELRDKNGSAIQRWEPARLKSIYTPRNRTRFNTKGIECKTGTKNKSAEIKTLVVTPQSAAIRVGTRALSMAALAGVTKIRELSGAGVAKKLTVTRQAVSLTNRATDEKVREATGGKSGAYGLRHTIDPRKGKARGARE
jgi:hypothetical protein